MKKLITIIAAILIFSPLFAQRGEGNSMWINNQVLEESGVSANVRESIRKDFNDMKIKLVKIRHKDRELHIAIREEFKKKSPNRKVIDKILIKIADLKREQALIIGKTKADVMFRLTPSQREKVSKHISEQRRGFMRDFRKRGRGRGRGDRRMHRY